MMLKKIFAVLILTSTVLKISFAQEKDTECTVKVELFYDTFCPDVVNFIQGKLFEVWNDLSDIMEIHWKPYGFTKVSNT